MNKKKENSKGRIISLSFNEAIPISNVTAMASRGVIPESAAVRASCEGLGQRMTDYFNADSENSPLKNKKEKHDFEFKNTEIVSLFRACLSAMNMARMPENVGTFECMATAKTIGFKTRLLEKIDIEKNLAEDIVFDEEEEMLDNLEPESEQRTEPEA